MTTATKTPTKCSHGVRYLKGTDGSMWTDCKLCTKTPEKWDLKKSFIIRSILDMRFGDGSGQPNLQINLALKEIMAEFSSQRTQDREEIIKAVKKMVKTEDYD